jgi:hypothetical protein
MALGHRVLSDKCFLQLRFPLLTPFSLLESESGFELVSTQLTGDTGKPPYIFTSIVYE